MKLALFVGGLLLLGLCALIHYTRQARHDIAATNAAADSEPQAETRRANCSTRGCQGHGLWWVRAQDEPKFRRVCWSCGQVGVIKGWWAEFSNREPYDHELDAEDWRASENECAGGAA